MLQLDTSPFIAAHSPGAKPQAALVPAVSRALALLDLLERQHEAMSLASLAAKLHLPKSSVHGLCSTLSALGYLRRHDDGCYFIGPRVMGLANAFAAHTSPAQEFAALWASFDTSPEETVILSVLDGTDVVYVATRHGMHPLGLGFSVGMRLPAHRAATGRAMLAFHDEARVKRLYPGAHLPPYMNLPAMRRSDLLHELALTRERGYGIDDEGVRQGVYCIAAPVFDATGQAVAGVGVCMQKSRIKPRTVALPRNTAIGLARQLTQRLGGPVVQPVPKPIPALDEGSSSQRAERRAASKPAPASRETRLALRPSKPAQAGLEPRSAFPEGDRPMYASDEGSSS